MAELATVARPYAKAVYELAQSKKKEQAWLEALEKLALFVENDDVRKHLSRPELTSDEQGVELLKLVDELKLDEEIKNLVTVVSHNDRLFLLPQIAEQYRLLTLSENSIVKATIYSAYKLSKDQVDDFVRLIKEKKGVVIEPEVVIDESLIGGVKIEYGDQVLDLSIKSRLAQLYATMLN